MAVPIWEERVFVFKKSDVESAELQELIVQNVPAGTGWEFWGHRAIEETYAGKTKVVKLIYRKFT